MSYLILRTLTAAICGLVMGAYTNTLEYRLSSGLPMLERSCRCPSCGRTLLLRDQLPLLSWLLLRGRCRSCGEPISPRYPLVEGGALLVYAIASLISAPRILPTLLVGGASVACYIGLSLLLCRRLRPSLRWLCGVLLVAYYQLLIGAVLLLVNIAMK